MEHNVKLLFLLSYWRWWNDIDYENAFLWKLCYKNKNKNNTAGKKE